MNYQLKINTITPVSIGDGDLLTAISDFVYDNKEVVYVNQNALEGALAKNIPLIDEYVEGVRAKMNDSKTRSNFDLKNFLEQRLNLTTTDYQQKRLPVFGIHNDGKLQIKTISKNAGQAYIPGSTLKGAIKGAILYDWYMNKPKGQDEITKIIKLINNLYNKLEHKIEEKEELEARKARRDRIDFRQFNDLKRSINDEVRNLRRSFEQSFNKLLGDVRDQKYHKRMDFSLMQVGDSDPIADQYLKVVNTKRLSLKKGSLDIPQCRECLTTPESGTAFTLKLIPDFKHPDLQYLNDSDLTHFFKVINQFCAANIDYDWECLDKNGDVIHKENHQLYDALDEFFEQTDSSIKANPNAAYLRIGAGKSYYYNSIGLAIYKNSQEAFKKMVKLFSLGKPGQKQFPITRVLSMENYEPLGFIKITH